MEAVSAVAGLLAVAAVAVLLPIAAPAAPSSRASFSRSQADLHNGPGGPWIDNSSTFYCGVFHTGNPTTLHSAALLLRAANDSIAADPGTCLRVFCHETSAAYVCADSDSAVTCGGDVGYMVDRLGMLCCDRRFGLSGQMFHPTASWNVVVGYGNCQHADDVPPAAYGVGNGGVNGYCMPGQTFSRQTQSVGGQGGQDEQGGQNSRQDD